MTANIMAKPNPNNEPLIAKILLVEDEMMIAIMIEDMIEELGLELAASTASPEQAIKMLDTDAIDLAILDVNLGDTDSSEVAAELAQRDIPFIFSTGYGSSRLTRFADRPVLTKPFSLEELDAGLRIALARRGGTSD